MNSIWLNAVRASGGVPWWRAGGAPEPVAVYEPAAAADLASSYIPTIATVGNATLDPAVVGGVAPTFSGGWDVNGTTQYLRTGIVPDSDWAVIIQISGWSGAYAIGSISGGALFGIRPTWVGNTSFVYGNANNQLFSALSPTAVLGLAGGGLTAYRNGISAAITGTWSATAVQFFIGAATSDGTTPSSFGAGKVLRIAVYDTSIGHATWIPAVSAAMAAL